jgi:hypothetical protein
MSWNARRSVVGGLRRLLVLSFCAVLTLTVVPGRASAQWWGGGDMDAMENPALGKRQLKQYSQILTLNPEQSSAAAELLAGYDTEYRAAVQRMREINKAVQEEVQQTGDWNIYQSVFADAGKKFFKKTEKLNNSLLEDIKALLDERQLQQWDRVQRMHRRQTTTRFGWLSGEKLDLTDVVAGMRLDTGATAAVAGPLEQYEIDLDRELQALQKVIHEQMEMSWQDSEGNWDQSKWEKIWKDMRDAGKRIADVNHRSSRQIQGLLPADLQGTFAAQVKLETYPGVYKQSFATRVLEAAEKIEDLDVGQREAIKGLKENHQRDAGAVNDKWAAAIAEIESGNDQEAMGGWWGGYNENPKIQEHRTARKTVDDKVVEAVKALLNEEQRKRLPDRKKRPEFDFDAPSAPR